MAMLEGFQPKALLELNLGKHETGTHAAKNGLDSRAGELLAKAIFTWPTLKTLCLGKCSLLMC